MNTSVQSPACGSAASRSYPSRQIRFGPAPLASFEDLPTDDQNSSSDGEQLDSIKTISKELSNITVVITDHDLNTNGSSANLSPNDTIICSTNSRDSLQSCNSPTFSQFKENKRKGSWTDYFRRTPSPTKSNERKFSLFNFKFFFKDDNKNIPHNTGLSETSLSLNDCSPSTSQNKLEDKDMEEIEIGIRIESTDQDSIVSPNICSTHVHVESCNDSTPVETLKEETKSNECENKMNNLNYNDDYSNKIVLDTQVNINGGPCCLPDNCKSCAEETVEESSCETRADCEQCLTCERVVITCECANDTDCYNAADKEDNDEEECHSIKSIHYDSNELELLLKCDELECNNDNVESQDLKPNPSSRRESKINLRLSTEKLKTSPIERPRSITPINICSFTAFINEFETNESNPSHCDKLTVTLPGTHSRNKFPRKSNPYIWQEFCEKGLKSPQIFRKRANSCFPEINENCFFNDTFDANCSPENLTPITPIKNLDQDEEYRFDDNFWDYNILLANESRNKELSDYTDKGASSNVCINNLRLREVHCSCDCNSSNTSTAGNNLVSLTTCSEVSSYSESTSDETETSQNAFVCADSKKTNVNCRSEFNEDQPLVSPCDCVCHQGHSVGLNQFVLSELSACKLNKNVSLSQTESMSGNENPDEDHWQLSPSTLSSTSSPDSSSQSVRLLDSSTTSNF